MSKVVKLSAKNLKGLITEIADGPMQPEGGLSPQEKRIITDWAREGERVAFQPNGAEKPKTIWGGLGNRSGLHSYAYELIGDKWNKSGARFTKKLDTISGGVVILMQYRNVTRDRGKWMPVRRFKV